MVRVPNSVQAPALQLASVRLSILAWAKGPVRLDLLLFLDPSRQQYGATDILTNTGGAQTEPPRVNQRCKRRRWWEKAMLGWVSRSLLLIPIAMVQSLVRSESPFRPGRPTTHCVGRAWAEVSLLFLIIIISRMTVC